MELIFWVFPSKNRGVILPPKMDGENFMEKPMNKWDDLGGQIPLFLVQHPFGLEQRWLDQ